MAKKDTKKKEGIFSKVKSGMGKVFSVGKTVCTITGFMYLTKGLRDAATNRQVPEKIHNAEATSEPVKSGREIFEVDAPDTFGSDLEYSG